MYAFLQVSLLEEIAITKPYPNQTNLVSFNSLRIALFNAIFYHFYGYQIMAYFNCISIGCLLYIYLKTVLCIANGYLKCMVDLTRVLIWTGKKLYLYESVCKAAWLHKLTGSVKTLHVSIFYIASHK